jgi:hypothetical protein
MATDKQIILDECRAAVAEYCCCARVFYGKGAVDLV